MRTIELQQRLGDDAGLQEVEMHLRRKRARYDDRAILIAERPREIGEAKNVGKSATVETCEQEPQASQPTHDEARKTKENA